MTVLRSRPAALALTVMLALPASAAAQAEISFGSGVSTGVQDGEYQSTHSPPFPFVEHEGIASQVLTLNPDIAPMFWGAVAWFPTDHAGLEVRVDYRRQDLGGVNTPYDISLRFFSRQPPDNELRERMVERSTEWPDTNGRIEQLTATAGLVLRAGRPDGASVRFAAVGGVTNVRGEFGPLGYTQFEIISRGVLFATDVEAGLEADSATTVGVGGGVEFQGTLSGRTAVVAGVRLFVPRTIETPVNVRELVFPPPMLREVAIEDVQQALAPAPVRYRPTTFDVTIGLRVRL